jgi:hypothetical protein
MSKKEKKELEMALATAESEHFRRSRRKMTCMDFVNVKLIGRGAFGEVFDLPSSLKVTLAVANSFHLLGSCGR